jgi:hypothetical protein
LSFAWYQYIHPALYASFAPHRRLLPPPSMLPMVYIILLCTYGRANVRYGHIDVCSFCYRCFFSCVSVWPVAQHLKHMPHISVYVRFAVSHSLFGSRWCLQHKETCTLLPTCDHVTSRPCDISTRSPDLILTLGGLNMKSPCNERYPVNPTTNLPHLTDEQGGLHNLTVKLSRIGRLAAWTLGDDRALVCIDVTTCQRISSTNPSLDIPRQPISCP